MPTYQVRKKTSGKVVKSINCTIAEMVQFEIDNPTLEVVIGAPILGYNTVTSKPDDGFRDQLKRIKKANRGSTINTF